MERFPILPVLCAVLAARPLAAQCPDGTPPPCGRAARPDRASATNSVAVLYFDSLSRDTANAYLADGGDADSAFAWLERARDQRTHWLSALPWDPMLTSLHTDPRFAALERRVGRAP